MALNCDERCRCQPKGVSPRIPQPGLRKCCWQRLWIVLRLWMSGVQLLDTLRNKLLCTLGRLRQQLRLSLRACEIRLRRTVRTDFLLRVPATLVIGVTDWVADERVIVPARANRPSLRMRTPVTDELWAAQLPLFRTIQVCPKDLRA